MAGALFYVFSKKSADFYSPLERTYVMFGCGAVFYTLFAAVRIRLVGPEILNAAIGSGIFWCAILYLALVSSRPFSRWGISSNSIFSFCSTSLSCCSKRK